MTVSAVAPVMVDSPSLHAVSTAATSGGPSGLCARSPIWQEAPDLGSGQCGFESLRAYNAVADGRGVAESPDLGALNRLSRNKQTAWRWDGVSLEQGPGIEIKITGNMAEWIKAHPC